MLALTRNARLLAVAFAAVAASAAQAITFSNVSMTFNPIGLGAASSWSAGNTDIDFFTPNFQVGDFGFGPARVGVLTITYEAMSNAPMVGMVATVLGSVAGSGAIEFQEVIEDLTNPAIIGVINNTVISNNLPFVANVQFTRGASHIKVKKDLLIRAEPDTNFLDYARVGLIEQNIVVVPEPATMVAVGAGITALIARRRRK